MCHIREPPLMHSGRPDRKPTWALSYPMPNHTRRSTWTSSWPVFNRWTARESSDFATPQSGPESSELASRCHSASMEWNQRIETLQHRKKAVDAVVPQLHAAAQSTVATDDDKVAYRTALAAQRLVGTQLASLRSEYWISALEAFGLFPNYTLLDDSVTLSVSVNWIHPETQEFEHTEFELTRGSAQALRDFAPGSTFYASGFAIAIDAVDLGAEGDAVHEWACCPACGFIADLGDGAQPPATCPRCGTAAIADMGQRLPVVELSRVSARRRRRGTGGEAR